MLTKLQQVQNKSQKVAEAIATVLKMEVEIIDTNLVRVAGTGKVRNDVGSRMQRGFVNKHVLKTGKHIFIAEAGHHEICKSCPLYDNCFYLAYIVYPIYVGDEIIGNINLVAFDERQKQTLCSNEKSLVEFLDRMAEFISTKVQEKEVVAEKVVLANRLQAVVDSVHEGVLAVDKDGIITHFNRSAEELLGLRKEIVLGRPLKKRIAMPLAKVIDEGKEIPAREIFYNRGNNRVHLIATVRPIKSENGGVVGAVASFRDFSETQKLAYQSLYSWQDFSFDHIIGVSEEIKEVKAKALKVARSDSSVLLVGESGTGKELFARAIHGASSRRNKPFVAVNCGAIPETLMESEFFGYEEGAFTGARRGGKPGKFELANGGTLFLDEISNMSLYLQAKLLRVLQDKQIERVGGTGLISVDVRIVAATNKDLAGMVQNGRFREDLYYRLSVIPLVIPPLRERKKDIVLLITHYMDRFNQLFEKNVEKFSDEALQLCLEYDWPGNVRELVNTVEYAINLEESTQVRVESLPVRIREWKKNKKRKNLTVNLGSSLVPLHELERNAIKQALDHFGWSDEGKQKAADALGISRATIYRKIQKYKLKE